MKFLLKLIFFILIILTVIMLALPFILPEDAVKEQITKQIEKHTGHKLEVNGESSLRFFPTVGASVADIRLYNVSGTTILAAENLSVTISALSIFEGKFEIADISIDTPTVTLFVDKKGQKNWMGNNLQRKQVAKNAADNVTSTPIISDISLPPLAVQLNHLSIINGTIAYEDAQSGANHNVSNANITLAMDSLSSPMSIEGNFDYKERATTIDIVANSAQSLLAYEAIAINGMIENAFVSAKLKGDLNIFAKRYVGVLALNSDSLVALQTWAKPGPAIDVATPLALDLKSNAECYATYCNFKDLNLAVDDIKTKGTLSAIWGGAVPTLKGQLNFDQLDLNPYMATKKTAFIFPELIASAHAQASAKWSKTPIDLSVLKSFGLDLKIAAKQLIADNVTLGNVNASLNNKAGRAVLSMRNTSFYGGKADVDFAVNTQGPVLKIEKRVSLAGFDIHDYLLDAASSSKLSGKGSLNFVLSAQGNSEAALVSSLYGRGRFGLVNGELRGVDIDKIARNVLTALNNRSDRDVTKISKADGSFNVRNGIMRNQDLIAQTAEMRLNGEGSVNLALWDTNYKLTPSISLAVENKDGTEGKSGAVFPIIVSGAPDNLNFEPDYKALLKDRKQLEKTFKGVERAVKTDLKDTRKQLKKDFKALRNIFKKPKPAPEATAPAQ